MSLCRHTSTWNRHPFLFSMSLLWAPAPPPAPLHAANETTLLHTQLLMELGSDMPVAQAGAKPQVNPKNIFRAMSIVFVPVAFTMPSGVLVYWTTTNIFGMLQRAVFELRPVQQALGWPMTEDMPQVKPETPREVRAASQVSVR